MRYLLTALLLAVVCVPLQAAAQVAVSSGTRVVLSTVAFNDNMSSSYEESSSTLKFRQEIRNLIQDFYKKEAQDQGELAKSLSGKPKEEQQSRFRELKERQHQEEIDFSKRIRRQRYEVALQAHGDYLNSYKKRLDAIDGMTQEEKTVLMQEADVSGQAEIKEEYDFTEEVAAERLKISESNQTPQQKWSQLADYAVKIKSKENKSKLRIMENRQKREKDLRKRIEELKASKTKI